MKDRVLVAGIGNIFHGDDAFGVEVAQRMASRARPAGVAVVDFGIRGFDLAFALLDGYEMCILVDVVERGGPPGTLYVIEPDLDHLEPGEQDGHGLDPVRVLRLAKEMGGPTGKVLLVGCEPETFGPAEEGQMGLSSVVAKAVDAAIVRIEAMVAGFLASGSSVAHGAGVAVLRSSKGDELWN
jgi:hydrogenase maturation protease